MRPARRIGPGGFIGEVLATTAPVMTTVVVGMPVVVDMPVPPVVVTVTVVVVVHVVRAVAVADVHPTTVRPAPAGVPDVRPVVIVLDVIVAVPPVAVVNVAVVVMTVVVVATVLMTMVTTMRPSVRLRRGGDHKAEGERARHDGQSKFLEHCQSPRG